jgi:hypothetical protein
VSRQIPPAVPLSSCPAGPRPTAARSLFSVWNGLSS